VAKTDWWERFLTATDAAESRNYKPHPIPANLMMAQNSVISAWMPKSLALDGNQPTHKCAEFLPAHRLPSNSDFEPKLPEHTVIPAWMPESSVQGWQTVGNLNLWNKHLC
jgi:hypothetical protein